MGPRIAEVGLNEFELSGFVRLRLKVWGLGFRVYDLGFRDLGFRI